MFEIMTHPEHVDRWLPLARREPVDWDAVLAGYNACHDWPSSFFWRELADAYPEAKVVLTVRDPEGWVTSFNTLMRNGAAALAHESSGPLPPFLGAMRRMRPLLDRLRRDTFGVELKPEAGGARRFCEALKEEGLLCKETHDNVIRFAPPLVIQKDDIDWALTKIEKVLMAE